MNGLADIERRELRAVSTYGFYDDPVAPAAPGALPGPPGIHGRRADAAAGGQRAEAEVDKSDSRRASWAKNCRRISARGQPVGDPEGAAKRPGCWRLFSPALAGPKLNLPGVAKFEKDARIVPDDARWRAARVWVRSSTR